MSDATAHDTEPHPDADDWDSWVESTEAKQPIRRQPRACGTEPHL